MYYKYALAASTSMDDFLVPKRFFVTSGIALEAGSELNAFDLALKDAGITDCNLVGVSSIIPTGAEETNVVDIPKGAITFCVMAKMTGRSGQRLGCGLAWSWGTTQDGERFGIVAEHHGSDLKGDIESIVRAELLAMAEARDMVLEKIHTRIESTLCAGEHGCVVAALVYAP
ncbi:MAG: pyruvoyl-dependent arginine decarboxylase [Planctomycetota bacterium]|jgi:arginine decarboxylase